jgi:GNAT superfamily N-acetyltransferase
VTFAIRRATAEDVEALTALLLAVVAAGASVGFMHPLSHARAAAFWQAVLASAQRQERIVLVAIDQDARLLGTIQLVLDLPDNQPHRADVAKMQVHPDARRRGVATALLRALEAAAREADRTVLVLDTATGSPAEQLYARNGWQRVGAIPGYALWPDGRPCSSTVFYKRLDGTPVS